MKSSFLDVTYFLFLILTILNCNPKLIDFAIQTIGPPSKNSSLILLTMYPDTITSIYSIIEQDRPHDAYQVVLISLCMLNTVNYKTECLEILSASLPSWLTIRIAAIYFIFSKNSRDTLLLNMIGNHLYCQQIFCRITEILRSGPSTTQAVVIAKYITCNRNNFTSDNIVTIRDVASKTSNKSHKALLLKAIGDP